MAVARPQLLLPIQHHYKIPELNKQSVSSTKFSLEKKDAKEIEGGRGKEICCIFFWQDRLCEVVRFHGWVPPTHQFGFGNSRATDQPSKKHKSRQKFCQIEKWTNTLLKVDLSTKSIVSHWWSERRGFLIVERLLKRKIGLRPIISISGFVVQSPRFL